MPLQIRQARLAELSLAALLATMPITLASGAIKLGPDPPVYVTNLTDAPVALQWQTLVPNTALAPVRGSLVPADATNALADEGLFWFYDPAAEGPVENVVFVSIIDADGAFVSQVVMEEEIAGTLATEEETALHITIEADGTLTLSVRDAE